MSLFLAALTKLKRELFKANIWEQSLFNALDWVGRDAWVDLRVTPVSHVDEGKSVVETIILRGILGIEL